MRENEALRWTISVSDELDVQIVPPTIPRTSGVILIRDADGDVAVFPFEIKALIQALSEALAKLEALGGGACEVNTSPSDLTQS